MKRAIITGSTGFIGTWLVNELIKNGVAVIALVRSLPVPQFNMIEENPLLKIVKYYSEEYDLLKKNKETIDVFYHLAWAGVSTQLKNDSELQMENMRFSLEMLEFAKKIGVKTFIATGTVAEYAFSENIMDVNGKQTPNDMYGAAKTATHYMLETKARLLDIPFNWAVLPSTFGEGRRDDNIITYTILSLLEGKKPQYGSLEQMWDFLYVGEVARALRFIGEKGKGGKTYAIGSGIFKPLRDYIMQIRDIINPKLELGIGEIPSYSNKAFSSCVSIYDLTKDTGFIPQVDFRNGIIQTIQYYKESLEDK